MTDDRKYRQRGYQDHDQRPASPRSEPKGEAGRRGPIFASTKETVRCDTCGVELSSHFEISFSSVCPKCRAELHTCRNCLYLDPAARYECSRPITERMGSKHEANRCTLYEARVVRVKETTFSSSSSISASNPAPASPDAARRAFETLFKKK